MLLTTLLQRLLPDGATLSPVIISTDKTQLTQFSGNKSAYPVYLTLGNIPRSIRRKPSDIRKNAQPAKDSYKALSRSKERYRAAKPGAGC